MLASELELVSAGHANRDGLSDGDSFEIAASGARRGPWPSGAARGRRGARPN